MIRNINLFILGLLLVGIGAALRHGERLGLSHVLSELPASTPAVLLAPRTWVLVGGVLMLASLIAGTSIRFRRRRAREKFEAVPLDRIDAKVKQWCRTAEPDVPLLVDYLVFQAIRHGASDIHFDPGASGLEVKYRLEGMVHPVTLLARHLGTRIVNRLKVLSNLVIYKDQTPQDGRFDRTDDEDFQTAQLKRSGLSKTDFRIAFMPTLHGERIVIRILGSRGEESNLRTLGMSDRDLSTIQRLVAQPQGMIILTGPTGSGKTTTIFAALQEILTQSEKQRSIATLEDPIEFDVANINQSQVDEKRDFTFEKGLRAILRQDPDVIMVGEIRDLETARIAIQAGMTGHLLITTVHAGTSAAVFSRLAEMGIPAFSLNSAITAVIAQRLVRNICPHCKTSRNCTEADLALMGLALAPTDFQLYEGTGCARCDNTGYSGRTAIFEILEITEPIRRLISDGAGSEEIYMAAKKMGLNTLWDSGLAAVRAGITTVKEIDRTIASTMK
ncbi:MAG: type II/IV secretion system protein [Deltaproteobacteria bacterium]|nr:type II/IV secretion system protein [Deltaproteobacteria bacterium]